MILLPEGRTREEEERLIGGAEPEVLQKKFSVLKRTFS